MTNRKLSHNALLACLCASMVLGACTAPVDRPLTVDGTRNANFDDDYAHCHTKAATFTDGTGTEYAATGAVVGGLIGVADADDALEGAVVGAAVGGLVGSAEAASERDHTRRDVLIRCMQNRGHDVIG
ncbi:glycine zipper family protein [Shimia sp. MMG029]|uniref:glycine zipper family protein n=1 Tax=Shimia sp. MMG029 TaxID=3021978 RepID=UPI0022FF0193|nr:glycine zipper family protein [Shimia sp. MMG029]MDA5558420.1 glycine zipper family protein [Shimia sp. MMG029]